MRAHLLLVSALVYVVAQDEPYRNDEAPELQRYSPDRQEYRNDQIPESQSMGSETSRDSSQIRKFSTGDHGDPHPSGQQNTYNRPAAGASLPGQQHCITKPPHGTCLTTKVCNNQQPAGCDYYTVTYDHNNNIIKENCSKDPKRPRCGHQFGGRTCDPHNGFGSCCSEDGYCGIGQHYCEIKKDCECCPVKGGCQSGDCSPRCEQTLDNKCGPMYGGRQCDSRFDAGPCCSKDGECGRSPEHCDWDQKCRSNCTIGPPAEGRCGSYFGGRTCPSGQCCSRFGFCGSSRDHCGAGCQGDSCTKPPPDNRCGPAFGGKRCKNPADCCSADGYCGQTTHCGPGCTDGPCDPDETTDPSPDPPTCNAKRPDQVLACPCKPGEKPIWQSIANAPCNWATPKASLLCPDMNGAIIKLGDDTYTFFCDQSYTSTSKIVTHGNTLFDCRRQCSQNQRCRAVSFWPNAKPSSSCNLHLVDGSFYSTKGDENFGGMLLKGIYGTASNCSQGFTGNPSSRPTNEGMTSEKPDGISCPEVHNSRQTVGGVVYEAKCNFTFYTKANAAPDERAVNMQECAERCSKIPNCEGAVFDPQGREGLCYFRAWDSDGYITPRPGHHTLRRVDRGRG